MKKQLFAEITNPEERKAAIASVAVKSELQKVRRHYSNDELAQMKEFISSESINLMDKREEFDAIKKEFNKAIKEYDMQIKGALKDVKRGFSDNDEEVFMVDDQDAGVMEIYDAKGELLSSRPLYANERQTKIVELNQAAG
jgi:hypothetical protein